MREAVKVFCQPVLFLIAGFAVLSSCAPRVSRNFRVLPVDQTYVLRSPERQDTPFGDILRSYNGFEPGHNWIDLEPSMNLRIENAYYEKGANRRGLSGYLGTEVALYSETQAGLELVSLTPMKNRPEWDVPVDQLITPVRTTLKYQRFFYSIVFSKRDNTHGAVLLAAATREELERLSAQLAEPETVCTPDSAHCTVFREACTVSVEMTVVLNGKPATVYWGSLLSSVVKWPVGHLEMKRLHKGKLAPVQIDGKDEDALRLPLLPGDEIRWR